MSRSISSIAVFCGSNFGNSDAYADGARRLGRAMAEAGITLVYGGTTKGLMGVVADALIEAGGTAHGVITEALRLKRIKTSSQATMARIACPCANLKSANRLHSARLPHNGFQLHQTRDVSCSYRAGPRQSSSIWMAR